MNNQTMRAGLCALSTALLFLVSGGIANASVVATWADPTTNSFTFADTGTNDDGVGTLAASNSDILLDLPVLGLTGLDASYLMTDSSGNQLATTSQSNNIAGYIDAIFEAGKIVIKSDVAQNGFSAGETLLTITFDSAIGVLGNVLGNDSIVGQNIVFTGPALDGLTATSEIFSFSVANLTPSSSILIPADMEAWTATTSFTSSATLVPVPAAVWLFGSGLLGLVGMARRKKV